MDDDGDDDDIVWNCFFMWPQAHNINNKSAANMNPTHAHTLTKEIRSFQCNSLTPPLFHSLGWDFPCQTLNRAAWDCIICLWWQHTCRPLSPKSDIHYIVCIFLTFFSFFFQDRMNTAAESFQIASPGAFLHITACRKSINDTIMTQTRHSTCRLPKH